MAFMNGSSSEVPAVISLARTQALRGLRKMQDLALDAADVAVRTAKATPVADLPTPSKFRGVPSLDAATRFTFDFATEVLNSQRDFALRLSRAIRSK